MPERKGKNALTRASQEAVAKQEKHPNPDEWLESLGLDHEAVYAVARNDSRVAIQDAMSTGRMGEADLKALWMMGFEIAYHLFHPDPDFEPPGNLFEWVPEAEGTRVDDA